MRFHRSFFWYLGMVFTLHLAACRSVESSIPPGLKTVSSTPGVAPVVVRPNTSAGNQAVRSPPTDQYFDFSKSQDEKTGEKKFSLNHTGCSLTISVKNEGGELIIGRHSDCQLPMDAYLRLWHQLLKEVFESHRNDFKDNKKTIHLVWGRISAPATDTMATVMSHRLALKIRSNKSWDTKRGKPKSKVHLNSYVRENAQPMDLFPELVFMVHGLGFSLTTEHIEKVLVGTSAHWPGEKPSEVGSDEKLPYDAQIFFLLNPVD